ncbi:MAG: CBS domain-containing protein, partial [Chloroflexota bacterium]|nr:CBS domain-containing protein [Chloroflexota bacterium]
VEQLAPRDRAGILEALEDEVAADVIEELSAEDQVDVLEALPPEKAADILEEMGPDEAADLVGDLPRDRQRELLGLMESEEAADVRELLAYNEGTAGGLMTTDYVAIGEDTTAAQALDLVRKLDPEMEQATFYLYVTDGDDRLVGVVNLRELIAARPDQPVAAFMQRDPISVGVDMDEDEVAVTIARYNLVALPVVDGDGRLQGIVTVDDALELALGERWRKRLPHVFEAAEER